MLNYLLFYIFDLNVYFFITRELLRRCRCVPRPRYLILVSTLFYGLCSTFLLGLGLGLDKLKSQAKHLRVHFASHFIQQSPDQ